MSKSRRLSRSKNSRSLSREIDDEDGFSNSRGATFPPNIEGMTSLKVDNITQRTGVNLLKKVFSKYGDLGDVYVPRYPDTFASRGFAFVRFMRKRDAEEAMRKMNGFLLDGRVLSIQMARYARPSPTKQLSSNSHRNGPMYSRGSRYSYSSSNGGGGGGGASRFRGYLRNRGFYRRGSPSRYQGFYFRSRSRSRTRDRRKFGRSRRHRSGSRNRSLNRRSKRSRSKHRSRSKSHGKDREKSRSKSRGKSESRSRSKSYSKDKSMERSLSRSRSRSKSDNRASGESQYENTRKSKSLSQSPSESPHKNINMSRSRSQSIESNKSFNKDEEQN